MQKKEETPGVTGKFGLGVRNESLRDFASKTGVVSGEWLWGNGVIGKRRKRRGQERCRMKDQWREGKEEPE